ncbi:hypothetical protein dsx2_2615 [Desulfovibrio sp. X2]|nr:hypothetical protein dsx2_2615 [Desulfovibrio sp. X2]
MTDPMQYERRAVKVIAEIAEGRSMSHSELARAAFGAEPKKIVRWANMRNPRKDTGKAQALTVADFAALSMALGDDPATMAFKVEKA